MGNKGLRRDTDTDTNFIYTHTNTQIRHACVCECMRVCHADDDPKNLHENFNCQRIHFHLKFMTCARRGWAERGSMCGGGVGAWQNEAFGVTFVLRDNFGATEKFSASASASVFGLIDAVLLLLLSLYLSLLLLCVSFLLPHGYTFGQPLLEPAPPPLPRLMRYKHINCEKCQASHITLDVFLPFLAELDKPTSSFPLSCTRPLSHICVCHVCVCVCVCATTKDASRR